MLLLRGASLPPLFWASDVHRAAKKTLDTIDDAALFGRLQLADEQMGAAARALLYLWTGWTADCLMFSQGTGDPERLYLSGLCERHNKRSAEAKAHFKQLDTHPIHDALTDYVLSVTAGASDEPLRRIREMLKLDRRWEPFLFCDAVAMAACGKIKPAGENIVRQIQCREFELLFGWCYEKATGAKLTQKARVEASEVDRRAAERERRLRQERRRRDEKRVRDEFAARMSKAETPAPKVESPAGGGAAPRDNVVGVACPKCGQRQEVSAAMRGKAAKCGKCGSGFLIPDPSANAAAGPSRTPVASAPSNVVTVLCPKCAKRLVVPAAARGTRLTCTECGVLYLVPPLQPAGTGA